MVTQDFGTPLVLSKNSSPTVPRKIRHFVAIRIGMNKMAEGDEYLDYPDETLERTAKPSNALLGALFGVRVDYELTVWTVVRGYHVHKTPGR